MKIAMPPVLLGDHRFNLTKQLQVVEAVYDPDHDILLERSVASMALLELAHDQEWLRDVLCGLMPNGFGAIEEAPLIHALHSTGAMLSAAEAVVESRGIAFAPVSGFHHAGYRTASRYCTFNGLVVAAVDMHNRGLADRVVIIDGDGHYGDGTQDIIDRLKLDWLTHVSLSGVALNGDHGSLNDQATVRIFEAFEEPADLVLYQAGADCHQDDVFKAGYLSDDQWRDRDATVFNLAHATKTPIVWNLAGGYNGLKTIQLHCQTFEAACDQYNPLQTRLPAANGLVATRALGQGAQLGD